MTELERITICEQVAVLSMWGHGWVGSTLMEKLDKALAGTPTWRALYQSVAQTAQRESVGTVTDAAALRDKLLRGYWLTNWDEHGCALFNPPPMNGLCQYVSKELAAKYKVTSPWGAPPI